MKPRRLDRRLSILLVCHHLNNTNSKCSEIFTKPTPLSFLGHKNICFCNTNRDYEQYLMTDYGQTKKNFKYCINHIILVNDTCLKLELRQSDIVNLRIGPGIM